jgi:hypothetical protein
MIFLSTFAVGVLFGIIGYAAIDGSTDYLLTRLIAGHTRQSAILSRADLVELVTLARVNGDNPMKRTEADYDAARWLIDIQIDAGNLPESLRPKS